MQPKLSLVEIRELGHFCMGTFLCVSTSMDPWFNFISW
jgi:hypothetical protein